MSASSTSSDLAASWKPEAFIDARSYLSLWLRDEQAVFFLSGRDPHLAIHDQGHVVGSFLAVDLGAALLDQPPSLVLRGDQAEADQSVAEEDPAVDLDGGEGFAGGAFLERLARRLAGRRGGVLA